MPKHVNIADDPAALRQGAEARLSGQPNASPSMAEEKQSGAATARALHELEVHQIELEMQNTELGDARDKPEALLEKYTDLYDFAPVGYVTLDPMGDIREANLAMASLLSIARSALVKSRFELFVAAADRPVFDTFLKQVFASHAREECDLGLQLEGRPPLDVRLEAIALAAEPVCRVAVIDITERKRADADRLILNKLESTGILAGGIAHDFNNLLTVILLNLEMAQLLLPPGPPGGIVDTATPPAAGSVTPRGAELAAHLEEAKQTSLLARGLTAQLVTFAGGGTLIRRATFLAGVIQESVRPALSGSNVRCETSLAEDLWVVEVDAGQIGQVIRNLVLNAREAMPHGGVVFVRAENVELGAQRPPSLPEGEYVRVTIADRPWLAETSQSITGESCR